MVRLKHQLKVIGLAILAALAGQGCTLWALHRPLRPDEKVEVKAWWHADRGDEAVDRQDYAVAEKEYLEAINLIETVREKTVSSWYSRCARVRVARGNYAGAFNLLQQQSNNAESYYKDVFAKGLYKKNKHSFFSSNETIRENVRRPDAQRFLAENATEQADVYLQYGDFESAFGKYQEAKNYYELKSEYDGNDKSSAVKMYLYPKLGMYHFQRGEYDQALEYFGDGDRNFGMAYDWVIAVLINRIAETHYHCGNLLEAKNLFDKARRLGSFWPERVVSLTMLAKCKEKLRETDGIEELYELAQRSSKNERTYNVERANALAMMGAYEFRKGRIEKAKSSYVAAKALREATATGGHPNNADVLNGLAMIASAQGEMTSATLLAEKALGILEASVVSTHPRLARSLTALFSLQALAGSSAEAAQFIERAELIVKKNLGPWRESLEETVGFYSMLLKESGKRTDAERLERLVRL